MRFKKKLKLNDDKEKVHYEIVKREKKMYCWLRKKDTLKINVLKIYIILIAY